MDSPASRARSCGPVMRSRCCAVSARREGGSAGRQLKQLTSQPVDHAGVVARFVLPEQENRREPGAVVTTEQPAIIRRPRQKNPGWAPKSGGEMGDTGVDGYDEIEAFHQRCRVREVFELGGPIDDVGFVELGLVVGPGIFLKADKSRIDVE